MKRFLLSILVIFAFGHIRAQSQNSDSLKSKTGILFNVVDLNLQGFNGGIGFTHLYSNDWAIQAGLDFNLSESDDDYGDGPEDRYQSAKGFGITADFVKYSPLKKNLKIYYGGGLGLSMSYTRYHYTSGVYTNIDEDDALAVSLRGVIGFEYGLNETFSLGFQQVIEGSYSTATGKSGSFNDFADDVSDTKTKNYNFGLGSTYLRLTLYF